MSYILEALRKADAERERGSVPDLHAQALPLNVSDAEVDSPPRSLGLWLGLVVALVAAAGAAWHFLARDDSAQMAPAVATVAAPPLAAPAPTPQATPLAAPAAAVAVPEVSLPPAQLAAQVAPPAPQPLSKAQPNADGVMPARPGLVPKPVASVPKPPVSPPRGEPAPPPVRVPALAELPAELRQQVPALVVGGSVYSPQASVRMVVINGQVFQEGNSLGPELKLEQVRPKTAVFSIRGQRFEVPL